MEGIKYNDKDLQNTFKMADYQIIKRDDIQFYQMIHLTQPNIKYLMEKIKNTNTSKKLIDYMIEKQSWQKQKIQCWFPIQIQEVIEGQLEEDVYYYLIYEDISDNYAPIYKLLEIKSLDLTQEFIQKITKLSDIIPFIDKLHEEQLSILDISLQNIWVLKYFEVGDIKYKILNRGIYQFFYQHKNDDDIKNMILDNFFNVYKWNEYQLVNKPFLGQYLDCKQSYECDNCNQYNQRNSQCGFCSKEQNKNCQYCVQLKKMNCERNQDLNAVFILLYLMTYPQELKSIQHDDFFLEQQKFDSIDKTDEDKHFYIDYFQKKQIFTFKILQLHFEKQFLKFKNVSTRGMIEEQHPNQQGTINAINTQKYSQLFLNNGQEGTLDLFDNNAAGQFKQIEEKNLPFSINKTTGSTQQTSLVSQVSHLETLSSNVYKNFPHYDNKNEVFNILKQSKENPEQYELYIITLSVLYFNNYCVRLEELDQYNKIIEIKDLVVLQIQIFWQLIKYRQKELKNCNNQASKLLQRLKFIYDQIENDEQRITKPGVSTQNILILGDIKNIQNNLQNCELKMEISTINTAVKKHMKNMFSRWQDRSEYKYFKLINCFKQILFCQTFNQKDDMTDKLNKTKKKICELLQ
ncbi:hypothetical protein TTHERM_00849460 (macronuclear) [Tetrahymena thermophila SB210]|uniref:Uncharacterized protein n=1 Tax=Tetrahymena thermophila (strain SB210) TaxID=312017 RepID=Q23R38_TETTS|nr:hypothetical protein TTHERM_00849460 [Tetrahymena thermophila SB210]EAR99003.3 hypothetical protein TTHERM_00849460 [Tetrahymena thermophila SB210]|eukprot:XP_001019248.3 hypothetical protein TTHERM_00849460 [Tetrahymena thermophila SB210]